MNEATPNPLGPAPSASAPAPMGKPVAAPLPPPAPPRQPEPAAAAPPVQPDKPPLFGGKRGPGRAGRADGLVPGSPEAIAADRAKDAARKRLARAAARAASPPPPLPSRQPAGQSGPPSPAVSPPGQTAPPAGTGSADVGTETLGSPVAWDQDALRPLCEQLIEAAEEGRIAAFVARCAEAGLTQRLVKEIEADAKWPKPAKVILARSLPRLAAKWLNRTGVSAEWEDEVAVLGAAVLIVAHDRKLARRLEELIAATRTQPDSPPPPSAAPPQPDRTP